MANDDDARHSRAARRDSQVVFIIDDDDVDRSVLQFMLGGDREAGEFERIDAAERHACWPADLVVVAATLVAGGGPKLIARWRVLWPEMKIFVICEGCDDDCVVAALHAGADDTLTRPFRMDFVRHKIEQALCGVSAYRQAIPMRESRLSGSS